MALAIGNQAYTASDFGNAAVGLARAMRNGYRALPQGAKTVARGTADILARGAVHAPIQTAITALPDTGQRWWANLDTLWSNKAMGRQYMKERVNQGLVEAAKELRREGRREQAREILNTVRDRVSKQIHTVRTNQAIAGAGALGAAGTAAGALYGGAKLLGTGKSAPQAYPTPSGGTDTQIQPATPYAQNGNTADYAAMMSRYVMPLAAGLIAGGGVYGLTGLLDKKRKRRALRLLLSLGIGIPAIAYAPRISDKHLRS